MIPILQFANSLYSLFGVDDALLIAGGVRVGGALLSGFFSDDEAKKLQEEVLRDRIAFSRGLRRKAAGGFTAVESRNLLANAEPRLNQIAANVSARGLGQSGAGAQVLAQATGDVFQGAQNQAAALLPGVLGGIGQSAGQLAAIEAQGNQAFNNALSGFARDFVLLQGLNAQSVGGSNGTGAAPPQSDAFGVLMASAPELSDAIDLIYVHGGFA